MAATEVSICNVALARIGQREFITSLDPGTDDSEPAAVCAVLYPAARDSLLTRYPWGFATGVEDLELEDSPAAGVTIPGWAYAYTLPAGFLVARYVFSGARPGQGIVPGQGARTYQDLPAVMADGLTEPFQVGAYVFTDLPDAKLVFTAQATNPAAYPPLFADALSWRLAADLALSVATKASLAQALEQRAEAAYQRAIVSDANARGDELEVDSPFIVARE